MVRENREKRKARLPEAVAPLKEAEIVEETVPLFPFELTLLLLFCFLTQNVCGLCLTYFIFLNFILSQNETLDREKIHRKNREKIKSAFRRI